MYINNLSKLARVFCGFIEARKFNILQYVKEHSSAFHLGLRYLPKYTFRIFRYEKHYVEPITQYTHVRYKNSNTQGSSPNVINVIFYTLRNCS